MQYRSEPGHALASFAAYRILSEKLRFTCFSQVPTGSDYPIFRLILLRKHLIAFDFYSSFLVSSVKYGFSIGEKYGKRIVAINFGAWREGLIALSFGHQYPLFS